MGNKVSIWIGKLESKKHLDSYIVEHYDDDDDDISSKFMNDFNLEYIDTDFQEVDYNENQNSKEDFFNNFSYSESFIDKIPSTDWLNINSLILLYYHQYNGRIINTESMKFIGVFDFNEE